MMSDYLHNTTIAVLYPGEMGSAFGKLLRSGGFHVITTAEGRSSRTQRRCLDAGLSVFDSLEEVLQLSDVVLSLVSPNAALPLANEVAMHVTGRTRRLIYLDVNSISPMTVAQISTLFADTPVDFLDAALFGLATQLQHRGTIYISGPSAQELVQMFMPLLLAKNVGDSPGRASALKMIVSGISKGLSGLFIETLLFAHQMNLLDESLGACEEFYPSIMEVIRRMLPTYPQHAARRCEELQQVEETMLMSGASTRIISAVREVTFAVARSQWPNNHDLQQWSIAEVITLLHAQGTLALPEARVEQIPINQTAGSSK